MVTILAIVLVGTIALLSAMVGGVWWRQERIAYQPPPDCPRAPADVRQVEYHTVDNQPLVGFLVEPDEASNGVLLAFHGNADLAVWQIPWAHEVARRTRWSVFLAEYRGYGGLGGEPTYEALQSDARAAWQAVQQLGDEHLASYTRSFALFGHSLGSGVATELASEIEGRSDVVGAEETPSAANTVTALVLQSPFTSARDMARIVSTRPVQFLWKVISRVHYDSRARLQRLVAPVWVAHGLRDWLVPVSMGRELFALARVPGRLLIIDSAGHNDVAEIGAEHYWTWLNDALNGPRGSHRPVESTRHTETSG
jgi:pimeloyl-ACP methyl ester carboxylesterase